MQGALVQVAQAVDSESLFFFSVFTLGLLDCGEAKHPILQRIVFHCTLPGPDVVAGLLVGHAYGRMDTAGPNSGPT